ncbi:MAG: AAA family ATPase [Hungatella sp.]|nr:AAA family ATPase [Hungatella sp.]
MDSINGKQRTDRPRILAAVRDSGFSMDRLGQRYPELDILKAVPQNPQYHGEGDVYTHTDLVCREVTNLQEWGELTGKEQELLFLAAAFHDIGKPSCTKLEEGKWTSPRHTIVGEKVFRAMAYRQHPRFGLTWEERETAAALIRHHGLPVWFLTKGRPERELLKAARSVPMKLLYLLSKADVRGRRSRETGQLEEQVELFGEYVKDLGVWEHPYEFANPYTQYEYFHRDSLWQGSRLYDDTLFDVYMMAGLPLAGKDTWIQKNGGDLPVISLDQIREEMGIPPKKGSSKVVQLACERARQRLRKKEPLIWNATNLIRENRERLCGMFAAYGARIHLIYLEVPYEEMLTRNKKRERYIPVKVLESMVDRMEMPASWETHFWERY